MNYKPAYFQAPAPDLDLNIQTTHFILSGECRGQLIISDDKFFSSFMGL